MCAFISVPPKEVVGGVASGDPEHLECVNRVQDPEIMEMDRLRRISWSATVGATDSRSIDTGLNELHRITGKGSCCWDQAVGIMLLLGRASVFVC